MLSNLLRAQWFRLTHTWLGCGCLACFVVLTLLVAMGSMNIRFMGESYLPGHERISPFELYDEAFVMLGLVPIVAGFLVSALVAGDLGDGTVKNLLSGLGARLAYGGAVLLCGLLACALLVALGMVCVEVIARVRGIPLVAVGVGARGLWFVQAALGSAAYTALVAGVAMATASRMAGMATALVLGLGLANTGLMVALEGVGVILPSGGRYLPGSLAWWMGWLGSGPLEGWGWLVGAAVVGAVGVAAVLLAVRRRGLA